MKNRIVSERGAGAAAEFRAFQGPILLFATGHRAAFRGSQHAPLQFARIFLGLPQTYSAEERVFISSALDSFGQLAKAVHKAAAEDDVIGDERFS